jgi:dethiobiotin synthetase
MGISRGVWKLAEENLSGAESVRETRASGVFVTATSTEVGKTVVAAALARTLTGDGRRVAVFKPALTGMDEFPAYDEAEALAAVADTVIATGSGLWPSAAGLPDHATLRAAARSSQTDDEISPYRFQPPMSPHLAAGLAGVEIDPERVMKAARAAAAEAEAIVVEGVGGLLVPLADGFLVRDLAGALELPLVVVARPGLGTINHTLLTLEAARAAGLAVALVVLNPWPAAPSAMEESNRETVAALGRAPVAVMPPLSSADPVLLAAAGAPLADALWGA